METVKLTEIKRYNKTSASGKNYTSTVIKTEQHGETTLSGFGNNTNETWVEGDEVQIEIVPVEKNGVEYLNFKNEENKEFKKVESNETSIEERLKKLEYQVGLLNQVASSKENKKSDEIPAEAWFDVSGNGESVPF